MKLLLRFIDYFLFTSMLTACCATGLCMATEQLIAHTSPLLTQLHILVFASTVLVYNAPRIARDPFGTKRPLQARDIWYRILCLVGLLVSAQALYHMAATVQLLCCLLGLFAFAYFLPLLPLKERRRLRDFGCLKITVLTLVWTVATSVLPIVYHRQSVMAYPFEVLHRMCFIFSLCVLFDLRDINLDQQNNIHTLAGYLGIRNSYRLVYTSLTLFVLLAIGQYMRFPIPGRLAAALLTAAATAAVAIYLRRYPSSRAYALLADGVMLVYAIAVLYLP